MNYYFHTCSRAENIQTGGSMNVQTEKLETIWHLEMLHPEELCANVMPPKTQLIRQ